MQEQIPKENGETYFTKNSPPSCGFLGGAGFRPSRVDPLPHQKPKGLALFVALHLFALARLQLAKKVSSAMGRLLGFLMSVVSTYLKHWTGPSVGEIGRIGPKPIRRCGTSKRRNAIFRYEES